MARRLERKQEARVAHLDGHARRGVAGQIGLAPDLRDLRIVVDARVPRVGRQAVEVAEFDCESSFERHQAPLVKRKGNANSKIRKTRKIRGLGPRPVGGVGKAPRPPGIGTALLRAV